MMNGVRGRARHDVEIVWIDERVALNLVARGERACCST